jgi:hypothetical protein
MLTKNKVYCQAKPLHTICYQELICTYSNLPPALTNLPPALTVSISQPRKEVQDYME